MAELILALDLPSRDATVRMLDRLPALRWVKVGSILMTAEGPSLIRELRGKGLRVFLDLKWHDIPNTVSGAVGVARDLGVQMATVHIAGGTDMMRAAADAAGDSLALVGVTALTSIEKPSTDYADDPDSTLHRKGKSVSSGSSVDDAVVKLARTGIQAGLSGVVCSPLEIQSVRVAIGPTPLVVVPGIRRPEDAKADQARVAGPAEAVRWGASHLVVGRPILNAPNPEQALAEFLSLLQ